VFWKHGQDSEQNDSSSIRNWACLMVNEAVNPLLLPEQGVCGCRDTRALMPPFREDVLCLPLVPSRVRYCYCSLVFIHSSQSRTVAWAHKWIVDICIQNQCTIVATCISDWLRSTNCMFIDASVNNAFLCLLSTGSSSSGKTVFQVFQFKLWS
jgi:hypothetical protein